MTAWYLNFDVNAFDFVDKNYNEVPVTVFLSGAQTENSCPPMALLGLFSRAGFPIVTAQLAFDDDLLTLLSQRSEALAGLTPHGQS
jgi:hypothetical protein